jgi:tetratricopeptide (TPR) repeat protein
MQAGYPRDADTGLLNFAKRCGDSETIQVRRHQALMKASDFTNALDVANNLIASDPIRAVYRYKRGQTYEELKDFEHALGDYLVSLQLSGTPSRVASSMTSHGCTRRSGASATRSRRSKRSLPLILARGGRGNPSA